MYASNLTAAKIVMRDGSFYFIFILPGLDKKYVSDTAVVKKVMSERIGCDPATC